MNDWFLQTFKLSDLKENAHNPRTLTKSQEKQLKASIKKFGLIDKPIVNSDGTIIGGHQRVAVLKSMKVKSVDCWVPYIQLNDEQISELCIRLNKNTGSWDYDILANDFTTTDLMDWGFNIDDLLDNTLYDESKDEIIEEKESKKKKQHMCPECGHTF
jgi:hypothetical protein